MLVNHHNIVYLKVNFGWIFLKYAEIGISNLMIILRFPGS